MFAGRRSQFAGRRAATSTGPWRSDMRLNPRLADGRQQIERAWRTANAPAPPNAGTGPKRHKAERQKQMSGEEMTQIRDFPMSESPVIPLRERRRQETMNENIKRSTKDTMGKASCRE